MHRQLTERIKKKFGQSSTRPTESDGGGSSIQARPEGTGMFLVGETVTSPGQQFDVDIIAVHGLNGDAYTTWTHSNGTFWLRDLLPACLPGCRVYTYLYPSHTAFSSSYATICDYSRGLLDSIQDIQDQSNETVRPVIFICHSLGGIVFKQALATAQEENERYGPILDVISGVVFLGTPHDSGNHFQYLGHVVGWVINEFSPSPTIQKDDSGWPMYEPVALQRLSDSVTQRLADLEAVTFYETSPSPSPGMSVVDLYSSFRLGIPHEVVLPLYENHRDMCRFPGATDGYKLVLYQLREIVLKRLTPFQPEECDDALSSTRALTEAEKSCLTLFSLYDVADYRLSLPKPAEGTCKWILSHPQFTSWRDETTSALLWLTGDAGCGKTILSSFLMNELEQNQADSKRYSIGIYFCDNMNKRTNGRAVLRSLIFQIISSHRSLVRHAARAFELQGPNLVNSYAALWNLFQTIVTDPKAGSVYIIIDALDECAPTTCRLLLRSINSMLRGPDGVYRTERPVKFILSGHPDAPGNYGLVGIPPEFRNPLGIFPGYMLSIDKCKDAYAVDLGMYIDQRMSEISQDQKLSPELKQSLQESLLAKPGLTFLWAHMVLSSFETLIPMSTEDFHKKVDEIPAYFQAGYHGLLAKIEEKNRDTASKLLKLILGSSRPLYLDEIRVALALNSEHQDEDELGKDLSPSITRTLQGTLGPLIRISHLKVSLVHQSAKKMLMLPSSAYVETARWFIPDQEDISLSLAEVCIRYLSLRDFSTDLFKADQVSDDLGETAGGPEKSSSNALQTLGLDIGSVAMPVEPEAPEDVHCYNISKAHCFYEYASLNWARHFAECQEIAPEALKRDAARLLEAKDSWNSSNWLKYFWRQLKHAGAAVPSNLNEVELAAYFGLDTIVIAYLLQQGPAMSQATRNSALYWAATNNHAATVRILLSAAADPNDYTTHDRHTPLIGAALAGNDNCVKTLLRDHRTDINLTDSAGRSALLVACKYGYLYVVELLLDQVNCDINKTDRTGASPLISAAGGGHTGILKELLKQPGIKVNHQDNSDRTAISWAAGEGLKQCLETLMDNKQADINLPDAKGLSPLMWAARNGQLETIRTLVRRRDLERNSLDSGQCNAISWACGHGQADAVKLLVRSGCTGINQKDVDGRTPLAWAIKRDSADTIRAVLSTNLVDIEDRDARGKTPLYWAVELSHLRAVRALLEKGADPEAESHGGKTVMALARELGHRDMVDELSGALNRRLA
ncbi:hypothetical protein PG984_007553 [Apiospora sp. TS-2023a]